MLAQRSVAVGEVVCWDYHAVAVERVADADVSRDPGVSALIWDPESRLPDPVSVGEYAATSFLEFSLPLVRALPWTIAADRFSSDRSHMKTVDGYIHPPPPWPPIGSGANSLARVLDRSDKTFGALESVAQWIVRLS
jgi:hypothetical protein